MTTEADIIATDCGSIVQLRGITVAGKDFIDNDLQSEGWQWMGDRLCVDHRIFEDVYQIATDCGLVVRPSWGV